MYPIGTVAGREAELDADVAALEDERTP